MRALPPEIEELPLEDRANHCRHLSYKAFKRARESSNPGDRAQLIQIASDWRILAEELEDMVERLKGVKRP